MLIVPLCLIDCRSRRPRPARRPSSFFIQSDDQRHQKGAKIGDDNGESIRCGRHPITAEEGAPLSRPCLREFIGQANRNIGRKNRSASFESPLNGLEKNRPAKLERSRNHPEIIEILEPAIGDAKRNQRLEFLRHDRFDRIGSKMRRGCVQQGGIVDVDSSGRNGVAKTNIDLDRYPRAGNRCSRADTHASIFDLLTDRRRCQRGDIKRHTVIGTG